MLLSYRYKLDCLEQGCLPQGVSIAEAAPARRRLLPHPRRRAGDHARSAGRPIASPPGSAGPRRMRPRSTFATTRACRPSPTAPRRARSRRSSPRSPPCSRLPRAGCSGSGCAGKAPRGPVLSPLERALAAVRASTANGHVGGAAEGARLARPRARGSRGGRPRARRGAARLVEAGADAGDRGRLRRRRRGARMRAAIPLAAPGRDRPRSAPDLGRADRARDRPRGHARPRLPVLPHAEVERRAPARRPQPDRRPRPLVERVLAQRRAGRTNALDLRPIGPQARPRPLLRHGLRGAPAGTSSDALKPFVRLFADRKNDLNPWRATFSAGTKIGVALERARLMLHEAHIDNGSVVLISDLDDSPADEPDLARALVTYQREGIPIRMVGINPVAEDVRYFQAALGPGGGSVTTVGTDKPTEIQKAGGAVPGRAGRRRRADRAPARAQRAGARPADLGEAGMTRRHALLAAAAVCAALAVVARAARTGRRAPRRRAPGRRRRRSSREGQLVGRRGASVQAGRAACSGSATTSRSGTRPRSSAAPARRRSTPISRREPQPSGSPPRRRSRT